MNSDRESTLPVIEYFSQRKLVAAAIGRLKASVGEEPKQTNKNSLEVETAKDSVTTIMDVRQQTSQLQLAGKTFDNLFTNTVTEDKTSTPAHPLAEQCIVNSPSLSMTLQTLEQY